MNPLPRTADELKAQPALATLPVLSASIDAVTSTLDVLHPDLPHRPPGSDRESAAMLLLMHLHACQELLGLYDHLAFDVDCFSDSEDEEPVDDIPF
jgi:hypothetical protein